MAAAGVLAVAARVLHSFEPHCAHDHPRITLEPVGMNDAVAFMVAQALRATVEHLENLGHETLAYVAIEGGVRLVARVRGMAELANGASVGVEVDPGEVHLFGEDGRALAG